MITQSLASFPKSLAIEPFIIPNKKIRQLIDADTVGEIKTKKKVSVRNSYLRYLSQEYFSGLVYRLDSRNIQQIKESNGFHPRVSRDILNPVLLQDVLTNEYLHTVISMRVQAGVVPTSKHIAYFNVGGCSYSFKYMIDTKVNDCSGLDTDATANVPENGEAPLYEVIFEQPLSFNSIVGYFDISNKLLSDTTTFYINEEYKGNFSWSAENVVTNYLDPLPKKDEYRYTKPKDQREASIANWLASRC